MRLCFAFEADMPVLAVISVVEVDLWALGVLQVYGQIYTVLSLRPLDVRQQRHPALS